MLDMRKSVLQSAYSAAGLVSSLGRISPPEDPLVGVHRQISATAELKRRVPEMIVVGSGYSYLQEWLPHVGQAVVRLGMADSIGLGRMVLSYPESAGRRFGRAARWLAKNLPHLQRLHHRSQKRHGFRLLSAGSVLQGSDRNEMS